MNRNGELDNSNPIVFEVSETRRKRNADKLASDLEFDDSVVDELDADEIFGECGLPFRRLC
jgi:hypothetical protein